MRSTVCVLLTMLLWNCAASQESKKLHYVVVPPERALLVIASQPDCPVVIEAGKLLNAVDGSRHTEFLYELRNRGKRPIKYVAVYAVTSTGVGNGPLYNGHVLDKPLFQGQKLGVGPQLAIVDELTPELREQLKLSGPLRAIVVLIVERVEFVDGSVFSGAKSLKALQDYLIHINSDEINSRAEGAAHQPK